jgi:hypothetical protein
MMQVFRKYYSPGLISLVFLPLLSCSYLYKCLHPVKNYCIQMQIPRKNDQFDYYHFPQFRNYKRVDLTGNLDEGKDKIRSTEKLLKNMVAQKDTIDGIWLHFTNTVKYQILVTLIDICNAEKAATYAWVGDDFWIVPELGIKEKHSVVYAPAPPMMRL